MGLRIIIEWGKSESGNRAQLTPESWARVRKIVKRRDGAICQYCGCEASGGEVDHVLPLAKGGTDALTNLVWACKNCNRSKGDKTLREWMQRMQDTQDNKESAIEFDIAPRRGDGRDIIV